MPTLPYSVFLLPAMDMTSREIKSEVLGGRQIVFQHCIVVAMVINVNDDKTVDRSGNSYQKLSAV